VHKKTHILFIVQNLSVPEDKRVWLEAISAKSWDYDVSVICPVGKNHKLRYENIQGIDIYRHTLPVEAARKISYFYEYGISLFWQIVLSLKIFFKKPFQIMHIANPPDHGFLLALFFKIMGVKYVFDHHDLSPELYFAKFGEKGPFYFAISLIEKTNMKTADAVISTNESYKEIANRRGKKSKDKIFVVRNGPDLSNITVIPPDIDFRDGFDFLVAYIGKIASQENFDNLLRIAKLIVCEKGLCNIKFVVMGSGPDFDEMQELSEEMSLSKNIEFTGYIPYNRLLGILDQCDIGVHPEYTNEYTNKSTMLKIMDYMLMGKPIVQFESKEGRVTAGKSSLYISDNDEMNFADAVVRLLHDPSRRKEMGEIGRNRIIESLHWGIQKQNLNRVYHKLSNETR
jgi:glycosyltransferase involved in cell wall biosynthesis